jgi:integrase
MPEFGTYTDHLSPIVLLAINTGLRRGELLQLNWDDVDLERAILTVRGEGAKSGKTRHVPLNAEAVRVLREWQGPTRSGVGLVQEVLGRAGQSVGRWFLALPGRLLPATGRRSDGNWRRSPKILCRHGRSSTWAVCGSGGS